jgi:hypothetical protein
LLLLLQIQPECIELLVPESFVPGHPLGGGLHGQGIQLAADHPALLRAGDQSRSFEHRQVLHEAGKRHAVRPGEVADRGTPRPQLLDHMPPRGIGQRREHEIEVDGLMLNH